MTLNYLIYRQTCNKILKLPRNFIDQLLFSLFQFRATRTRDLNKYNKVIHGPISPVMAFVDLNLAHDVYLHLRKISK